MAKAPTVFISYSHDSPEHIAWVVGLGEELRRRGIDVILDTWDLRPGENVARFMTQGVNDSDRVLIVCSTEYARKANGVTGGVAYESMIVTSEVIGNTATAKFIPLVRGNPTKDIPPFLASRLYIDFSDDSQFDDRIDQLCREIHGAPRLAKPPLGPNPYAAVAAGSVAPTTKKREVIADSWFTDLRSRAFPQAVLHGKGNMEVAFGCTTPLGPLTHQALLDAARRSAIHTFGWPIGVVLESDGARPRPRQFGIEAEIVGPGFVKDRTNYDFWALRNNGDFYTVLNMFEEERNPSAVFFNTRIVRVTEALQYCRNVFSFFGAPPSSEIEFLVRHSGLRGRTLSTSSPNRDLRENRVIHEDTVEATTTFSLPVEDDDIVVIVKQLLNPLFSLFDYFQLSDGVYEDIVREYIAGRAT